MYRFSEIQLFSKLSEANLARLRDQAIVKNLTKQSIVFYEGDKSNYIYALLEGTVKLYKTSPKGTQIQINRFDAPVVIGEYACFEKVPFPATCEFLTDGVIAKIPTRYLFDALQEEDFALEMIKSLTSKIMILSSLVHKETIYSSEAKVAKMLIENSEIFYKLKHNEIASILNITPETLSRILKKFKTNGLIEGLREGRVLILDLEALDRVIETNKVHDCTNCIAQFKVDIGYDNDQSKP
jgi:CRP/FNR family transcriptional regulator